jgi:hypothetical protein
MVAKDRGRQGLGAKHSLKCLGKCSTKLSARLFSQVFGKKWLASFVAGA